MTHAVELGRAFATFAFTNMLAKIFKILHIVYLIFRRIFYGLFQDKISKSPWQLEGNFGPVKEEITEDNLKIEGEASFLQLLLRKRNFAT